MASQIVRKRIEEAFGWAKATAGFHKSRHRGLDRVGRQFTPMAAYNLIRLRCPSFEVICADLGIEHRLTKPRHLWTNG